MYDLISSEVMERVDKEDIRWEDRGDHMRFIDASEGWNTICKFEKPIREEIEKRGIKEWIDNVLSMFR